MPITGLDTPKYTPSKELVVTWDSWKKGLNTFLRETEIDKQEMAAADNLLLVGAGVPSKRWGSQDFFQAGGTGGVNFILPIKDSSDNIQVLSITDSGILGKKSSASYTPITGVSWPSGSIVEGTTLGGNVYLLSQGREMVKYDFTTLTNFATLAMPTGVQVSNISGTTGATTWSWRVTAVSKSGGETLGSTPASTATLPLDISSSLFRLQWTPVSAASGDLTGYNVYRGQPGGEIYIGGAEADQSTFFDFGAPSSDPTRETPTADTTGGLKAKFVIRYQDRLIVAGIPDHPTQLWVSGRWPVYHERFDYYGGGSHIEIEPDSGENITGIGIFRERIVVFKENSVWQVGLNNIDTDIGNILEITYQLLTASQGCSSHRSIVPVENDIMFSNTNGMYTLRFDPKLLTVLNTAELSAKIRPFFDGLTNADLNSASAIYADKKYVLSFPNSKKSICFDRERLAFTGPWDMPFGINQWAKYIDSEGIERWIAADHDDNMVTLFSPDLLDDKGETISTVFKSRKEDFGDWTVYKTISELFMNFRYVKGTISVNIYVEDRSGSLITAKSVSITGAGSEGTSGFGSDLLGNFLFGGSNNDPTPSFIEEPKRAILYKTARLFQIEVRTTGRTDNYELLGVKAFATSQGRNTPQSWKL